MLAKLGLGILCLTLVSGIVHAQPREDAYRAGARLYSEANYSSALEQFVRVLEEQPSHQRVAEARYYAGEAALQLDRIADAHTHFGEFLKAHINHGSAPAAWLRYSQTSLALGDATTARANCERLLKNFPQSELKDEIRLTLGKSLEALNEWDAAQQAYSEVSQQSIHAWPAQVGMARVLVRRGEPAKAARALVATAWPDSDDALTAEATWVTANAWMALGRPHDAVNLIDQILERFPAVDGADRLEYCAALAWQQAGDRASAMSRLRRIVVEFPQSPWADEALALRVKLAWETQDRELVRLLADDFIVRFGNSPHRAVVVQYRNRAVGESGRTVQAALRQ